MKVIFVDIDGPLAWGTWAEGRVKLSEDTHSEFTIPYPWVKEDCEALKAICESTDANLVVSSDWRRSYSFLELRTVFEHYGIPRWKIIDSLNHYNPRAKMSSSPEWDRACQIKTWVKAFRPKHWIAIDDMNLGYHFLSMNIRKWRHVQVNGEFCQGSRLRDKVEECVDKLNR